MLSVGILKERSWVNRTSNVINVIVRIQHTVSGVQRRAAVDIVSGRTSRPKAGVIRCEVVMRDFLQQQPRHVFRHAGAVPCEPVACESEIEAVFRATAGTWGWDCDGIAE